jgi:type IV secretion system protein VirB10
MSLRYSLATLSIAAGVILAQEPPAATTSTTIAAPSPGYVVAPGTRIPLGLINTLSTKSAAEGDRVYLETVFPVMTSGRIVIPPGSWVAGTVTEVKRPGRVKGRGELFLRFDSLTLPNGVTREFRARVGGVDGQGGEEFDKAEGKIQSEGNKAGDARAVAEAAGAGASVGLIAGSAAKHLAMGGGIGAAAGATAGLMYVLLSRGPDAVLSKGTTIEMITDRPLQFAKNEIDFGMVQPGHFSEGAEAQPAKKAGWSRWPI